MPFVENASWSCYSEDTHPLPPFPKGASPTPNLYGNPATSLKKSLCFAYPPHDGFAFIATPSRRRCAYVTLSMIEKNRDVKDCSVASKPDNPYSLNCRQKVASRKPLFTDLDIRAFTRRSRRREVLLTTKGHLHIGGPHNSSCKTRSVISGRSWSRTSDFLLVREARGCRSVSPVIAKPLI